MVTAGSTDPVSWLKEVPVAGSVARVTEISARSDTSFEDAIKVGVERATSSLRGVTSAWVKEQSVEVSNGAISGYRVNMLVTFVLE
jgi:dodecin